MSVPVALSDLYWLKLSERGIGGVVDGVVRALFGTSDRPSLGTPPAFTTPPPYSPTADPVDALVLHELIEHLRVWPPGSIVFTNEVEKRCAEAHDISSEAFLESIEVLVRRGAVVADRMLGGLRWWVKSIPPSTWLEHERVVRGVDIPSLRRSVLARIVNDGERDSGGLAAMVDVDERTVISVLEAFMG